MRKQNLSLTTVEEVQSVPIPHSHEENQAVEWLEIHLVPTDVVEQLWDKLHSERQSLLKDGYSVYDYLKKFPALKTALGPTLVRIEIVALINYNIKKYIFTIYFFNFYIKKRFLETSPLSVRKGGDQWNFNLSNFLLFIECQFFL